MALAVVIVLLVIGSLIFHFVSPWYFTDLASNWSTIDFTVNVTFVVTGIVFVAVNLFTAYCLIRYRHRKGHSAHYEPENHKLESTLTTVTALGVVAMLTPGLFVWGDFISVPDDAVQFEALGKQWHWSYRFPGEDGVFGKTDVRLNTPDNPMGLDPEDPNGMDDILVMDPTVHLPADQPIHALLRSTDVLHNFTVPQFRVKMDLVPGMVTYQWFTPMAGNFDVLCEELCGLGHFAMRGKVVVEPEADFQNWLDGQPTFAETQARPVGNAQLGAANYAVCAACHGPQGQGNLDLNAPKLAGLGGWYIRRQLRNYQQGIRGASQGDVFGAQMAPMAQTLVNEATLENVIAYIETLPDEPTAPTISGDAARGQRIYMTCAGCHGDTGGGRWNTNAPRLARVQDWYLVRQLQNFKQQIRGGHERDVYGEQMHMMANVLIDDVDINDVVAYIDSLR